METRVTQRVNAPTLFTSALLLLVQMRYGFGIRAEARESKRLSLLIL